MEVFGQGFLPGPLGGQAGTRSCADLGLADPTDDEIAAVAKVAGASPYVQVRSDLINKAALGVAIRAVEARAAGFDRTRKNRELT